MHPVPVAPGRVSRVAAMLPLRPLLVASSSRFEPRRLAVVPPARAGLTELRRKAAVIGPARSFLGCRDFAQAFARTIATPKLATRVRGEGAPGR
eukprot:768469-Hanusia_phi.AAC.2